MFSGGQGWIFGRSLPPDLAQEQQQGVPAYVLSGHYQRPWAELKTGNYLSAWSGQQHAQGQQAEVAILTNLRGEWLETATGNLWGWCQGTYFIPELSGEQLPGITQQYLQQWLTAQGREVIPLPWGEMLIQQLDGTVVQYLHS